MTETGSPEKPKALNEEQLHNRYSVDAAMKHYKNDVYYKQREGGTEWFHGRVTNTYRNGYDNIKWDRDK